MSLLRENDLSGGNVVTPAYDGLLQGQDLYDLVATTGIEIGRITEADDTIIANAGRVKRFEDSLGSLLGRVTIKFEPVEGQPGVLVIFARKRHEDD